MKTSTKFLTMTALEISAEYDAICASANSAAQADDWAAYKTKKSAAATFARAARAALCQKIDGCWYDSTDAVGFEKIEATSAEDFVSGYSLRRAVERRDFRQASGF